MSSQQPPQDQEEPAPLVVRTSTQIGGFGAGFKVALIFGTMIPFMVFLIPFWIIYVISERLAGRPWPPSPLAEVSAFIFKKKIVREREAVDRVSHHAAASATRTVADKSCVDDDEKPLRKPIYFKPSPMPETNASFAGGKALALITGGARRVGAAIARDLAGQGFRVVVAYHTAASEAQSLVEEIRAAGGVAECFAVDMANPESILSLLDGVTKRMGPLRVVINNAARFTPTTVDVEEGGGWEEMDATLRVNLLGPLWLAQQSTLRMEEGGIIINIADIWGERPLQGYAAYCASKAGLIMMTRVLAKDLAPKVRVNAIAPGGVLEPDNEEKMATYLRLSQRTPLAQAASVDAVVKAVRYLLAADYVTGEVLRVDGGRSLF